MNEKYFVIGVSEDGDPFIYDMTKDRLQKALSDDDMENMFDPNRCMPDVPSHDPNYWKGRYIIVHGSCVVPRAVQKVTEWEI